jgi:hypothetical protein
VDVPPRRSDALSAAGDNRTNNWQATTGFYLGLASIFLAAIGIIPILCLVFSAAGLATTDPAIHKNKWMAAVGLVLGILYTLVYMNMYGHLG